ncbi:hypothetical protein DNU06_04120 [Putridiphycobacter roseus]|uniref:Uncharacterized protein n=1 Tax=Putridiphycobacter roseus TaxID=2219161 RepID=A0A2W1NFD7_9FLAO|nr:T9SS type A sorting domain-containing protein [Putridiphycobacter roseus]PZE17813.1 hypothetical protein DNU06_04120 [Putridiphycobacter roseus]
MKTKIYLLLFLMGTMPMLASAQTSTITSIILDSTQYQVCDTTYYINISPQGTDYNSTTYGNFTFYGSNVINSVYNAEVIWGDGDTTLHTGTAVTVGTSIIWNVPISHLYAQDGMYTITVNLTDPTSNTTVTSMLDVTMGVCSAWLNPLAFLDCNNDGIVDSTITNGIPITISNANNTYTSTLTPNGISYYNVIPGNYTISIDPSWLSANNYLLSSITPSSIDFGFNNYVTSFYIDLICDPSQFIDYCLDGTAFCDANNNGVLDSTETVLGSVPLTLLLPNGSIYTETTDPNGLYSFNFFDNSVTGGQLIVDQNWLNANGYYNSSFFNDSLPPIFCGLNAEKNIPIICDTNSLSVGCINGYVFCDDNLNGVLDSNETIHTNAPVILEGGNFLITVYTDSNGYYSYTGWQFGIGDVFVSVDQNWQSNNSAFMNGSAILINNLNCANNNQVNLGLNCVTTVSCADLWTSVTPWIGYYQNTTNSVYLKYGNYGSSGPGNYTITLDYPSGVTPVTSSINNPNYTISGNTITWTLSSNSSYMYHTDVIYFNTPAGIVDSTFHVFSSTISSGTNDCDSSNNYSTLGMYVGNSYDPNDKSVNKPLIVDPSVQDEYTYVIRFQNTGTAPAQDVYIMDSLSSNLDLSTFKLIESSHPMQLVDLGNGILKFDFPQIWLPDSTTNEPASHGNIVYKIKEKTTLGEGDIIENTAHIFFDQNPAIVTNTTKNINTVGLGINTIETIGFNLYPNPTAGELNIVTEQKVAVINVFDLNGKLLMNYTTNNEITKLDVSHLSNGLYTIQVISDSKSSSTLFMKR